MELQRQKTILRLLPKLPAKSAPAKNTGYGKKTKKATTNSKNKTKRMVESMTLYECLACGTIQTKEIRVFITHKKCEGCGKYRYMRRIKNWNKESEPKHGSKS